MYDIQEVQLTAGEQYVIDPKDGVEAFAVKEGQASDDAGKTLPINDMIEVRQRLTVTATMSTVLIVGVNES